MQRKKETRPESLQAKGRAHKSNAMVADPFAKCTRRDGAALLAAVTLMFAIITWCEAGALPAIAYAVTTAAVLAVIEIMSKGEPVR